MTQQHKGRPKEFPGEVTVRVTARLPETAYRDLMIQAGEMGVLYNGFPAPGTLARQIIMGWLSERKRAV